MTADKHPGLVPMVGSAAGIAYADHATDSFRHPGSVSPVWTPYEKLKMRLGWGPDAQFKDYVSIYQGPNTTFVFVAAGDKALILEDDVTLFPSDSLIAQFQLFTGGL